MSSSKHASLANRVSKPLANVQPTHHHGDFSRHGNFTNNYNNNNNNKSQSSSSSSSPSQQTTQQYNNNNNTNNNNSINTNKPISVPIVSTASTLPSIDQQLSTLTAQYEQQKQLLYQEEQSITHEYQHQPYVLREKLHDNAQKLLKLEQQYLDYQHQLNTMKLQQLQYAEENMNKWEDHVEEFDNNNISPQRRYNNDDNNNNDSPIGIGAQQSRKFGNRTIDSLVEGKYNNSSREEQRAQRKAYKRQQRLDAARAGIIIEDLSSSDDDDDNDGLIPPGSTYPLPASSLGSNSNRPIKRPGSGGWIDAAGYNNNHNNNNNQPLPSKQLTREQQDIFKKQQDMIEKDQARIAELQRKLQLAHEQDIQQYNNNNNHLQGDDWQNENNHTNTFARHRGQSPQSSMSLDNDNNNNDNNINNKYQQYQQVYQQQLLQKQLLDDHHHEQYNHLSKQQQQSQPNDNNNEDEEYDTYQQQQQGDYPVQESSSSPYNPPTTDREQLLKQKRPPLILNWNNLDTRGFFLNALPRGGWLQCRLMKKSTSFLSGNIYELWTESSCGSLFLASAKKKSKTKPDFLLSTSRDDFDKQSTHYAGKIQSSITRSQYDIYDNGHSKNHGSVDDTSGRLPREEIGHITYKPHLSGKTPRKLAVLLPVLVADHIRDKIQHEFNNEFLSKSTAYSHLWKSMQECQQRARKNRAWLCLLNKPPRYHAESGQYVLDFCGRAPKVSVKNFQLVYPEEPDEVLFQLGRLDEDNFSVDFRFPLAPMQAFAIALSSLDYKWTVD